MGTASGSEGIGSNEELGTRRLGEEFALTLVDEKYNQAITAIGPHPDPPHMNTWGEGEKRDMRLKDYLVVSILTNVATGLSGADEGKGDAKVIPRRRRSGSRRWERPANRS